jgi:dTDP-4-amino-4,6-dideoxygalactose transaminase
VVFVDIDPVTLCVDANAFEKAITPRTRAVVPVHMYGCMCDMDAIMEIARRHSVKVVEDTAHQHGSRWRHKGAGAIGDVGSFSFQQSKILTCGEGGAVTTDDDEVYAAVHAMKHVGWTPDMTPAGGYGHNYRVTEMQAVLLRGGMTRIAEQTRLREENALAIEEGLKEIGGPLRVVGRDPRVTRQAYYCLTLHYDPAKAGGIPKSAYFAALTAEGCPILPTYPPVYRAPLLNLYHSTSPVPYRDQARIQDYANLRLPNIERAVGQTAGVMWHPHLLGSREYTGQILAALHKVADNLPQVKKTWRETQARKAAD